MKAMDRIVAWNAQQQAIRVTIPILLLKAVVGFVLAGFVLAILVPFLHSRGIGLREWMIWTIMAALIAVCVGPDLYHRYRHSPSRTN